jgi:disease resistance protein RPM1
MSRLYGNFAMVPSMFPRGAMPRLETFEFCIQLEDFSQGEFTVDDLALSNLPSLQRVVAELYGKRKVTDEVSRKVQAKLRHEADAHPNNPSIDIRSYYKVRITLLFFFFVYAVYLCVRIVQICYVQILVIVYRTYA